MNWFSFLLFKYAKLTYKNKNVDNYLFTNNLFMSLLFSKYQAAPPSRLNPSLCMYDQISSDVGGVYVPLSIWHTHRFDHEHKTYTFSLSRMVLKSNPYERTQILLPPSPLLDESHLNVAEKNA